MNGFLTFILSYAAITAAFYALSNFLSHKPRQYAAFTARTLASIAALVLCATYGVVASIALRIVGKAGLSQWTVARSFKYTMWLFTGVWFDIVEGKEYLETRPAVFVGNHQTYVFPLRTARSQVLPGGHGLEQERTDVRAGSSISCS